MRLLDFINEQNKEIPFDTIERDCSKYINDLKKIGKPSSLLLSGRKSGKKFIERKVRKNRRPKDTPEFIHDWLDERFEDLFGIKLRSNSVFVSSEYSIATDYGKSYIIFPIDNYSIYWSEKITDLYDDFIEDYESDYEWYINDEIPDGLMDEIESNYEHEYGEGEEGVWIYNNNEYEPRFDKEGMIEYIKEIEEDDDIDIDDLEWKPEITFDEYIEEYKNDYLSRFEKELSNVLNSYQSNNLKNALDNISEIMLVCDKYYGVNFEKLSDVISWLNNIGVDTSRIRTKMSRYL